MIKMSDLYMGDDPEIIAHLQAKFGMPKEERCDCGNKPKISYYNPDGQELHLCHLCYFRMHVGHGGKVQEAKQAVESIIK